MSKYSYGMIIGGTITEIREVNGDHIEIIIKKEHDERTYKLTIDAYDQDGNMPNTEITEA